MRGVGVAVARSVCVAVAPEGLCLRESSFTLPITTSARRSKSPIKSKALLRKKRGKCWDALFTLISKCPIAVPLAGIIVIVRVSGPLGPPGKAGSPSPSREKTCPSYAPAGTTTLVCRPPGSLMERLVPPRASSSLMASVACRSPLPGRFC